MPVCATFPRWRSASAAVLPEYVLSFFKEIEETPPNPLKFMAISAATNEY
jgi:hypothetical protein